MSYKALKALRAKGEGDGTIYNDPMGLFVVLNVKSLVGARGRYPLGIGNSIMKCF